jgi:hypothetical protein
MPQPKLRDRPYAEISRIVLNPRSKDVRHETYAAFITELFINQATQKLLTVDEIREGLSRHFELKSVPAALVSSTLDQMQTQGLCQRHGTGWILEEEAAAIAVRESAATRAVFEAMLEAFVSAVQALLTFKLDAYQTFYIRSAFEKSLYDVFEAMSESNLGYLKGVTEGGRVVRIQQAVTKHAAVLTEPTIERPSDIQAVMPSAVESVFLAPSAEFSMGLLQTATKHVMWRVIGADPELKTYRADLFKGVSILLDTNILISALNPTTVRHQETTWFLDATRDVGVELLVSDSTVTEYQKAVEFVDYLYVSSEGKRPEVRLVNHEISRGFFESPRGSIDWATFISRARTGVSIFQKRWGARIVHESDFSVPPERAGQLEKMLADLEGTGLGGKPRSLVGHDARNILLVQAMREAGKTDQFDSPWFVTHDAGLRRADSQLTKQFRFKQRSAMSVEGWFELIYPFLWTEVDPENASKAFARIVASGTLPLPPPSADSFVSYLALQLDLPGDEEEILRRIITGSVLRRALERGLEEGSTNTSMAVLGQILSDSLVPQQQLAHQREVTEKLAGRVRSLQKKDPEAFIEFKADVWAEGLRLVETASTNKEKKDSLENFAELLLNTISGLRLVKKNAELAAEEIDLLAANNWMAGWGDPILVECKNWTKPVGSVEIVSFRHKLKSNQCRTGILIAKNGVTGTITSDGTLLIREALQVDGIRLVLLSLDDLKAVNGAPALWALLSVRYYVPHDFAEGTRPLGHGEAHIDIRDVAPSAGVPSEVPPRAPCPEIGVGSWISSPAG